MCGRFGLISGNEKGTVSGTAGVYFHAWHVIDFIEAINEINDQW